MAATVSALHGQGGKGDGVSLRSLFSEDSRPLSTISTASEHFPSKSGAFQLWMHIKIKLGDRLRILPSETLGGPIA